MRYTKENQNQFRGIDNFFEEYPISKTDKDHPQYHVFKTTLLGWGVSQSQVDDCWKSLIDGVNKQNVLNQIAEALTVSAISESGLNAYSCGDLKYADVCRNVWKTISRYEDKLIFYKSVVKASNENYVDFADKLKTFLSVGNAELSLWSGGYDLSPLSQSLGKCPLEQTKLGHLLDTLPLTTNWKLEAPLWNIISRTFVSEYRGSQVHVYLRTVDQESVLLRQEVPMLNKYGKKLHWHIFYQNGTKLAEIGGTKNAFGQWVPMAVNVGDFKNGWASSDIAFEMLAQKLNSALYKENYRAVQQVLNKELPEYHAPFAYYE